MKVSESQASVLVAIVLNGKDQGDGVRVPDKRCEKCGNYLARFQTSPGLRTTVAAGAEVDACVTTKGYGILGVCPRAAAAAPLLDALRTATRAR